MAYIENHDILLFHFHPPQQLLISYPIVEASDDAQQPQAIRLSSRLLLKLISNDVVNNCALCHGFNG
jgi:hypothetical protein